MRFLSIATSAIVLASGLGAAAQAPAHEKHSLKPGEVAVIGCLQRESDYRAQNNKGQGGPLNTGLGTGNEYVLVQAKAVPATGSGPTQAAAARDFSLTGQLEKEMVREVGRMVEVVGTIKENSNGMATLTASLAHAVGDFCPAAPAK